MEHIYLSRRNLLTLLSKLDRKKANEPTACTIVKQDNQHPVYPQTMQVCKVTALEDTEYYVDREPGKVHLLDEPK
jgi:hypothetical protein